MAKCQFPSLAILLFLAFLCMGGKISHGKLGYNIEQKY